VNDRTTDRHTKGGDAVSRIKQINREMAERCLASSRQELESKQGAKFDMCYVGMQIGAHMHMVDATSVLQKHVSPELQQIFSEANQSTEQHLQHARRLMETLEKSAQSTASRDTDSQK
jgi:predicted outer membrane protein